MIDWTFALLFRPDIVKVGLDSETAWLLREVALVTRPAGRRASGPGPTPPPTARPSLPSSNPECDGIARGPRRERRGGPRWTVTPNRNRRRYFYPGSEATGATDTDDARDVAAAGTSGPRTSRRATEAAFPSAPSEPRRASSLNVELGLWRERGEDSRSGLTFTSGFAASKQVRAEEGLRMSLTERARFVAVEHGVEGPLPVLKSCLYLAFRNR